MWNYLFLNLFLIFNIFFPANGTGPGKSSASDHLQLQGTQEDQQVPPSEAVALLDTDLDLTLSTQPRSHISRAVDEPSTALQLQLPQYVHDSHQHGAGSSSHIESESDKQKDRERELAELTGVQPEHTELDGSFLNLIPHQIQVHPRPSLDLHLSLSTPGHRAGDGSARAVDAPAIMIPHHTNVHQVQGGPPGEAGPSHPPETHRKGKGKQVDEPSHELFPEPNLLLHFGHGQTSQMLQEQSQLARREEERGELLENVDARIPQRQQRRAARERQRYHAVQEMSREYRARQIESTVGQQTQAVQPQIHHEQRAGTAPGVHLQAGMHGQPRGKQAAEPSGHEHVPEQSAGLHPAHGMTNKLLAGLPEKVQASKIKKSLNGKERKALEEEAAKLIAELGPHLQAVQPGVQLKKVTKAELDRYNQQQHEQVRLHLKELDKNPSGQQQQQYLAEHMGQERSRMAQLREQQKQAMEEQNRINEYLERLERLERLNRNLAEAEATLSPAGSSNMPAEDPETAGKEVESEQRVVEQGQERGEQRGRLEDDGHEEGDDPKQKRQRKD